MWPAVRRAGDAHVARARGQRRAKGRLGRLYLGARDIANGCLAILGFEGGREEVAARRARALKLVRRCGGLAVGRSPGGPGSDPATRPPTCATSCSRTG